LLRHNARRHCRSAAAQPPRSAAGQLGALTRRADSAHGGSSFRHPRDMSAAAPPAALAPPLRWSPTMNRSTRKLHVRTETLRPLTDDALRHVAGGFIMRDSVIVRTSGRVVTGPTDGCAETIDDGARR
jgi:hypothetical protein